MFGPVPFGSVPLQRFKLWAVRRTPTSCLSLPPLGRCCGRRCSCVSRARPPASPPGQGCAAALTQLVARSLASLHFRWTKAAAAEEERRQKLRNERTFNFVGRKSFIHYFAAPCFVLFRQKNILCSLPLACLFENSLPAQSSSLPSFGRRRRSCFCWRRHTRTRARSTSECSRHTRSGGGDCSGGCGCGCICS